MAGRFTSPPLNPPPSWRSGRRRESGEALAWRGRRFGVGASAAGFESSHLCLGRLRRRSASLASSAALRLARLDRSPSASACRRQAMRSISHALLATFVASPNTSAYRRRSAAAPVRSGARIWACVSASIGRLLRRGLPLTVVDSEPRNCGRFKAIRRRIRRDLLGGSGGRFVGCVAAIAQAAEVRGRASSTIRNTGRPSSSSAASPDRARTTGSVLRRTCSVQWL
jgi:hypothetical protein